jgi:hypothetical protein
LEQARTKLVDGVAILVCAYAERDRCDQIHIPGSIALSDLEEHQLSVPHDEEIVFYCA